MENFPDCISFLGKMNIPLKYDYSLNIPPFETILSIKKWLF